VLPESKEERMGMIVGAGILVLALIAIGCGIAQLINIMREKDG
jgi:hypothetical protein